MKMPRRTTRTGVNVKVGRTGGEVRIYNLTMDEPTVEDALDTAGISSTGRVRVNGDPAELDDVLQDGDIVTVTGKISGGRE